MIDATTALLDSFPDQRGLVERVLDFSRKEAALAVFGRPSRRLSWARRFEGHHLLLNVTVADG